MEVEAVNEQDRDEMLRGSELAQADRFVRAISKLPASWPLKWIHVMEGEDAHMCACYEVWPETDEAEWRSCDFYFSIEMWEAQQRFEGAVLS